MSELEFTSDRSSNVSADKISQTKLTSTGVALFALSGAFTLGFSAAVTPFLTLALRKVCLPFVPATKTQLENVRNVLKIREKKKGFCVGPSVGKRSFLDIGSGDERIAMESVIPSMKMSKGEAQVYTSCPLYSVDQVKTKLFGLQLAACDPSVGQQGSGVTTIPAAPHPGNSEAVVGLSLKPAVLTVAGCKTSCSLCSMEFENRHEQSEHFRSDWHLYNLKLKLRGLMPITENEFEDIVDNLSSSISGSDTDSDDEDTDSSSAGGLMDFNCVDIGPYGVPLVPFTQQEGTVDSCPPNDDLPFGANGRKYPKIFLKNSDGELISVYRCVLYHKKNPPLNLKSVLTTLKSIPGSMYWAVFLAGGGHFAATIFENGIVVAHKTFHRYTVRAKQGKSQGSRDNRGNAPRSAGASLRRHNESALVQDVQDLLSSWSDYLKRCDLIFVRAPSHNQQMLFSNKSSPLNRNDQRIRVVPFHTRRPTHNETRRVHEMLASVECYGNECEMRAFVPRSPPRHFSADTGQLEIIRDISQLKRNLGKQIRKNQKGKHHPSESAEEKNKSEKTDLIGKGLDSESSSDSNEDVGVELSVVDEEIKLLHLQEDDIDFECPTTNDNGDPCVNNDKPNRNSNHFNFKPVKKGSKEKDRLKNLIYNACKTGDISQMKKLLSWLVQNAAKSATPGMQDCQPSTNSFCQQQNLSSADCGVTSNSDGNSINPSRKTSPTSSNPNPNPDPNPNPSLKSSPASSNPNPNPNPDPSLKSSPSKESPNPSHKSSPTSPNPNPAELHVPSETDPNFDTPCDSSKNSIELSSSVLAPGMNQDDHQDTGDVDLALEMAADIKFPEILNERWGSDKRTLLHMVSQAGHLEILYMLLEAGADPALCNNKGIPPYIIATKETRNEFRRFMGKYPDKYGYRKAQIPGPLTPEMEAEKKQKESLRKKAKQQRLRIPGPLTPEMEAEKKQKESLRKKAKQQRLREKKQIEQEAKVVSELKAKREEEERRYKNLSEREKRALAAERRILKQKSSAGESKPILSRCSECFCDISGLIPYEYYDFRFCTPKCLKEHRFKSRLT